MLVTFSSSLRSSELERVSASELTREPVPIEVVERYSEGKRNKARCVASNHQDTHSSLHLYHDHVHCYARGFHGDVTDVSATNHGYCCRFEAALDLARGNDRSLPQFFQTEGRPPAMTTACKGGRL